MTKRKTISDDDRKLFQQSVDGATRLSHDKVTPSRQRPKPVPRQSRQDDAQVIHEMLSGESDGEWLETGDELSYQGAGLQRAQFRKLKRGQFSIEAELDLHNLTVVEAKEAVVRFFHAVRQGDSRCVRIIHGKGHGSRDQQPVLKCMVNTWLRQRDEVLAFCSARPNDGGTGAVYVLLKRLR